MTKILEILNTQWLIILNKFDEDLKDCGFFILVYFWFSVILHESVSSYQALAKASSRNCLFWSPFFGCYCHPIVLSFISLVLTLDYIPRIFSISASLSILSIAQQLIDNDIDISYDEANSDLE